MPEKNTKYNKGFSLVESLIAIAIFVLLAGVIYQTSASLIKGISIYRENTAISSLANQYMEIVHNLPYSKVGTLSGNPHGELPDLPNAPQIIINNTSYQIYYVVNYIDDPADDTAGNGDFASNDYKQVKLYVKNVGTDKMYSFLTNITPKGLENLDAGGALSINISDASGQPVPDAKINIKDDVLNINLTRTVDANGNWIEVGLPNGINAYHLTASKTGYSTDQTYPITLENPSPTKADSTILNGQVTKVSFSIDKLSNLSFKTLNQTCQIMPNVNMEIKGSKKKGEPDLVKFDHNYTSSAGGEISLNNIEWDNYLPIPTDNYMIYGSSPAPEFNVLPNTDQNINLLLGPKTTNSLLVIVKDVGTDNPLESAIVKLQNSVLNVDKTKITGGSTWNNNDWTGGFGQTDFTDETKYFADDGNISTDITPNGLRLYKFNNDDPYPDNGRLISSTLDTGATTTVFTTINWQPTSEDPSTMIKFQIAVNNNNTATTTWNFTGPDGTAESYYTTSGTNITAPNARYIRYKVFLSTVDNTKTPVLTSLNINYISGCFTPGQVIFPGLQSDFGKNYQITVNAAGYAPQTISSQEIKGYQTLRVSLSH